MPQLHLRFSSSIHAVQWFKGGEMKLPVRGVLASL
jgi:hypothetical protein